MRAALQRQTKHVEDMRASKNKGISLAVTPPTKPRKVMYVTPDSSSEDERSPPHSSPQERNNAGERLFLHTIQFNSPYHYVIAYVVGSSVCWYSSVCSG